MDTSTGVYKEAVVGYHDPTPGDYGGLRRRGGSYGCDGGHGIDLGYRTSRQIRDELFFEVLVGVGHGFKWTCDRLS